MSPSSGPRKYPASSASSVANTIVMSVASAPICSEVRPP